MILSRLLLLAASTVPVASSPESAPSTDRPRDAGLELDTQTVDGVLEMRHPADAMERTPQWTLDSVPIVVIDGGDDPDYELSNAWYTTVLSDDRAEIVGPGDPRSRLLGPDAPPVRQSVHCGAEAKFPVMPTVR